MPPGIGAPGAGAFARSQVPAQKAEASVYAAPWLGRTPKSSPYSAWADVVNNRAVTAASSSASAADR